MSGEIDLPAAKSQAEIIKRIAHRLHKYGIAKKDSGCVNFANHLDTEAGYLLGYLGAQ